MELLRAREAAMLRFRPVLREHGLTEQQWRVIRTLADTGDVDASELARRSYLLAPSLTRILQHLVKEGLVTRTSDRNDQRRSVLALSAKGRRVFDSVGPDSVERYAEIEEEFGRDRLRALYELLTAFYTTLDRDSLQSD
jgi:homoprotocatechuate degradation regulator HpaR